MRTMNRDTQALVDRMVALSAEWQRLMDSPGTRSKERKEQLKSLQEQLRQTQDQYNRERAHRRAGVPQ